MQTNLPAPSSLQTRVGGGQAWAQSQSFAGQAGLGARPLLLLFLSPQYTELDAQHAGPVFKKQEKNAVTGIKGTKIESFCLSSVVLMCWSVLYLLFNVLSIGKHFNLNDCIKSY